MHAIFKGKLYGTVTLGERGQFVIPAQLREALRIKSGDQLMVFAKPDKGIVNIMPSKDFTRFLEMASRAISKLETKVAKKN